MNATRLFWDYSKMTNTSIDHPSITPPRQARPPSRVGKRPVTSYVDKATHKRLRMLAIELEKSNQQILHEALQDYLDKHEK